MIAELGATSERTVEETGTKKIEVRREDSSLNYKFGLKAILNTFFLILANIYQCH